MNTFNLQTEGFKKSVSLKVKHKECEIPSLLLYNSKCIENCVWTSEYLNMDFENEKGLINEHLISALELFLKTNEGKQAFNLFMDEGQSIVLNNKELYKADCRGDFFNIHSLHFREQNKTKVDAVGFTDTQINRRCVGESNLSYLDYHSKISVPQYFYRDSADKLEKHSRQTYIVVKINLLMSEYEASATRNKWSEERLVAQIAHTIGHEFFIHAYRKAIPSMKAYNSKDFKSFNEIFYRPTGEHGDYDHMLYLKNHKDFGLNTMYSFQKSLKNIIGVTMYNSVIKQHDEKYNFTKEDYSEIPKSSIDDTEY